MSSLAVLRAGMLCLGILTICVIVYSVQPYSLRLIYRREDVGSENFCYNPRGRSRNVTRTLLFTDGYQNIHETFETKTALHFERLSPQLCGGYRCRVKTTSTDSPRGAHMAVFFGPRLRNAPPQKSPCQLWVFASGESQNMLSTNQPQLWNGVFNYSLTFVRPSLANQHDLSYSRSFSRRSIKLQENYALKKKSMIGTDLGFGRHHLTYVD